MLTVLNCLTTEHDLRLVVLAALVCLIGVCAAVRLFVHSREVDGTIGLAWLALTGVVAGASVWATHFIAMLGYDPSFEAGYEPVGTVASLMIAIVGAIGAFSMWHLRPGKLGTIASGLILAGVIGAMHYIGMNAFQTKGVIVWDPVLVTASFVLAMAIAPLALLALGKSQRWRATFVATGLLAVAICSLHFTGMAAVTIMPIETDMQGVTVIDRGLLAAMVAGVASILVSAALLVAALDRWHRGTAHERLMEALEAMTDGLAYYDAHDRLMVWNGQYQRTCPDIEDCLALGITFEQILRLGLERGHYSEAIGREEDWLAERMAARRTGIGALEQRMADGRWLRIQDRRSALGGTVSTIIDVTDLKTAAAKLEQARDAAEEANRAKSEFLANMSHEIRTPLNGVLGVAEVLSKTDLSQDQKEMLRLIAASGTTLQQLLSDILDIARVESGRLTLSDNPFDLAQAVRDAGQLYQAAARDKGLQFFIDVSADAEVWALGDVVRVKQVLTNLVSNAVKFTQTGFVRLTVERAADRDSQAVFRFSVEDTGVGFDAAGRDKLFNRFEQADGSITRRFGGTGLGLAISRQLAEMMGGDIDCESELGGGSAFFVTLPMFLTDAPAVVEEPGSQTLADAECPVRILLADDHPTNRKVIELILSQIQADLVCVENGAQAVAAFDTEAFDLVLMDMQMPVMDGLAATRALRDIEMAEARLRTPIVMLTANALPEHVEAAHAAGADRHLAKPVSVQSLLDCVFELTADGAAHEAPAAGERAA
ncbi:MHYT domain-containing protein [Brevundimonas aveniformis]|uniref:MHYT domain-containing protein n=1 Tax=Brevundimonas aveniformis TaxID=370977 RepID=UPI00041D9227|nr:MHYT domain-containing protein [Brevundimonas aveniformis]